jgi:secondary thiamine-phosphate synthase enzyme
MHSITVPTRQRNQMIDVTHEVQNAIRESGIESGQVTCFVPHTTAGITIQENADPDVCHDVLWKLEELVDQGESGFLHAEGNSDSHIKASLVGSSVTVFVESGRLVFGTWQGIYFCEFDGPRQRKMLIKCVGD